MLLVLAALAVTAADPSDADRIVVTNPAWERLPTGDDIAHFYPERAQRKGVSGAATVQCLVSVKGTLTDCRVLTETPAGENFGDAALRLTQFFRMRPKTVDGQPTAAGSVVIPIRFQLPDGWSQAKAERIAQARACYGQVAHRAENAVTSDDGWRAAAYWSFQLSLAIAGSLGPPSAFEKALAEGHAEAASGTLVPPKGADLQTCLFQVPKK